MKQFKSFCCDANKDLYEQYYRDQCGSGMPVYQSSQMQRGHGLGSVLSGFFQKCMAIDTKWFEKFRFTYIQNWCGRVANDVVTGSLFKESAKKRVPEGIKTFVSSQFGQSGVARERRISLKFEKKKKSRRDIFDSPWPSTILMGASL